MSLAFRKMLSDDKSYNKSVTETKNISFLHQMKADLHQFITTPRYIPPWIIDRLNVIYNIIHMRLHDY